MKQPNVVDQQDQEDFMIERSKSVVELGYISEARQESFDWSILEDVIAGNPELYDSLQLKSKVWATAPVNAPDGGFALSSGRPERPI